MSVIDDIIKMYSEFFDNPQFADIKIHLEDDTCKIELSCHKIILCAHSKLFKAMLSGLYKEDSSDTINLTVSNALVTYDVIMSFYGLEEKTGNWQYQLERLRAATYLQSNVDQIFMKDLIVPVEGFGLLSEIATMAISTPIITKCILRNLPFGYDLSNIPKKIINNMIDELSDRDVFLIGINRVQTMGTKKDYAIDAIGFDNFLLSLDNRYIIYYRDSVIKIYDTVQYKIIQMIIIHNIKLLRAAPNNKLIVISSGTKWKYITAPSISNSDIRNELKNLYSTNSEEESINIFDIVTGQFERNFLTISGHVDNLWVISQEIDSMRAETLTCLSEDNIKNNCRVYINYFTHNNNFLVYDFDTGALLKESCITFVLRDEFKLSPNDQFLLMKTYSDELAIYSIRNEEIINVLPFTMTKPYFSRSVTDRCPVFSNDNTILVWDDESSVTTGTLNVWDIYGNKLINSIPHDNLEIISSPCISKNNKTIHAVVTDDLLWKLSRFTATWDIQSGTFTKGEILEPSVIQVIYSNTNSNTLMHLKSFI